MSHNGGYDKGGCHPEIRPLGHFRRSSRSNDFFHKCSCMIDLRFPANLTLKVRCFLFIYHLQQKYFEPVLIDLHNHEGIITYT